MSRIETYGFVRKSYKLIAKNVAMQALQILKQPDNLEVAIRFVSKHNIKKLNLENRGIDKVTDVLSFPATLTLAGNIVNVESEENKIFLLDDGFLHLGDMALCVGQCKKQAREFGNSIEAEIKKLVIHSILHLLGFDHIKDEDYLIMNKKEIELDKKITLGENKNV